MGGAWHKVGKRKAASEQCDTDCSCRSRPRLPALEKYFGPQVQAHDDKYAETGGELEADSRVHRSHPNG